ncbi:MAG: DHH family phosphoesterase [Ruminococcus sp.]|nr:DHH family phosphoesterase [Ruminococcus sp.]
MKGTSGIHLFIRITTIALAVCAVISSALLSQSADYDSEGKAFLVISTALAVLLIFEYVMYGTSTKKYIAKSASQINKTEKESLLNFPAPTVIIDSDNCIVWYNRHFGRKVYTQEEAYGLDITELFKIDIDQAFTADGDTVCHNNKFYTVTGIRNSSGAGMSMLYFSDKTELVELSYENRMSRQSVIIIMIDYYEEILSNIKESEKAHILVNIEQLIESFMEGTTGISRRSGNDRFYVILEERYLQPIIDKRFEILEQARKITVGERSNITLSIGIGRDSQNLAESEKYAKLALDMCLGRGGDQAAVRTENGYEFYGGLSKGMSKNTRVKSRMAANALLEIINTYERVLIMGHSFGDLDSIGSATGLCSAIKDMGKECYVVVDPERNLAKLMIKHVIDNTIKSYYISPSEGFSRLTDDTLLIITDTHNPDLVDSQEILRYAKHIVVIDHHRLMVKSIENNELFYHEPSASSACEMVAELLEYFPESVKISSPIAEVLLAGIMLDTKNFVMNTGVRTFEAAAYLRKLGADTVAVKKMFANTLDTYRNKARIIDSSEIYHKCAIAYAETDSDNIKVSAAKAADEMLEISGVNASFVLYELNGKMNISARSLGSYNVQIIMEALGGGGHHQMAACQLDTDLTGARKMLYEAIDDYIRNN